MRRAWILAAIGCGGGGEAQPTAEGTQLDVGRAQPTHPDPTKVPMKHGWSIQRLTRSSPEAGTTTCATFRGEAREATWDDCSDRVRRALACKPFKDGVECACLENVIEKWRCTARDLHVETQAEATRVARTNCHESFEGF